MHRPGRLRREEARPVYEEFIADRRVVKLRPVPQEPCRRREEPASVQDAHQPGCPRGRGAGSVSASANVSLLSRRSRRSSTRPLDRPHAAGRRLSLVERRGESRARSVRLLRVGDGPSRFLGTKRWKKPETASIITRTFDRMEGFRGVLGHLSPDHLRRVSSDVATADSAYFRHSLRVQTCRAQRSSFRRPHARCVSCSAVLRQLVCPLRPKPRSGWAQGAASARAPRRG